jgi:hypothetical protein
VSEETLRTLILALLGTGGATFIWTVVRSIIAYQNSAEGREDKAVARLEKFESDCREQLVIERKWGVYWQRRAATLEYGLRQHGIDPPPAPPEPERIDS